MLTPVPRLSALYKMIQPIHYIIEGDICTMGRSAACQIVASLKIVSRLHAQIERVGSAYLLSDAGSFNGTFVNGQRLREPHWLQDQDLIGLGINAALLRFELQDVETMVQPSIHLRFDPQTATFFLNEKPVDLEAAAFYLLHHLYQHAGKVCSLESCAEAMWNQDYDPDLDLLELGLTMGNLWCQLHQVSAETDLIQTMGGVGYMLRL